MAEPFTEGIKIGMDLYQAAAAQKRQQQLIMERRAEQRRLEKAAEQEQINEAQRQNELISRIRAMTQAISNSRDPISAFDVIINNTDLSQSPEGARALGVLSDVITKQNAINTATAAHRAGMELESKLAEMHLRDGLVPNYTPEQFSSAVNLYNKRKKAELAIRHGVDPDQYQTEIDASGFISEPRTEAPMAVTATQRKERGITLNIPGLSGEQGAGTVGGPALTTAGITRSQEELERTTRLLDQAKRLRAQLSPENVGARGHIGEVIDAVKENIPGLAMTGNLKRIEFRKEMRQFRDSVLREIAPTDRVGTWMRNQLVKGLPDIDAGPIGAFGTTGAIAAGLDATIRNLEVMQAQDQERLGIPITTQQNLGSDEEYMRMLKVLRMNGVDNRIIINLYRQRFGQNAQ